MLATILGVVLLMAGARAGWCIEGARVTAYVRTDHGPRTFDGTSIYTDEAIAAASWDIPIGWYVDVDGLGTYRVADRGGGLGSSGWIDIAVWTRAEAYALTSVRDICVYPPGDAP
jgi:3D (Asp-Asp-Asp) domain-containing protein